jgi:hypothetical protein
LLGMTGVSLHPAIGWDGVSWTFLPRLFLNLDSCDLCLPSSYHLLKRDSVSAHKALKDARNPSMIQAKPPTHWGLSLVHLRPGWPPRESIRRRPLGWRTHGCHSLPPCWPGATTRHVDEVFLDHPAGAEPPLNHREQSSWPRPEEPPWKTRNGCCFEPLHFGIACYTANTNRHNPSLFGFKSSSHCLTWEEFFNFLVS